jgi:hypothetical protein
MLGPFLPGACWRREKPPRPNRPFHARLAYSQKSEEVTIRIPIAIANPRVRAASGKAAEATKILDAAIAEATRAGIVAYQFEARAALGEVEIQYGNRARGREVLARLAQEASSRGFGLIARQAVASVKSLTLDPPKKQAAQSLRGKSFTPTAFERGQS